MKGNADILIFRSLYDKFIKKLERKIDIKRDFKKVYPDKIREIVNSSNLDINRAFSIYTREKFNIRVNDIFVNWEELQKKWEEEFFPEKDKIVEKIVRDIKPVVKYGFYSTQDFYRILTKQMIFYSPKLVINMPSGVINPFFFKKIKELFDFKVVSYHGATPLSDVFFVDNSIYDLFISPFLPNVIKFRQKGIKAELTDLAFFPEILKKVRKKEKFDIVFSGSLHAVHSSRKFLIEKIAERFRNRFHLFTQSEHSLTPVLKEVYRGEVFGLDHLTVLSNAKIVVNHHGDILPWAHNQRLFESTGVGSLLITDNLPNLGRLFEVGKEVLAYSNVHECLSLIERYLDDEEGRRKIAEAGQKRTLRAHTYKKRIDDILKFFEKYNIII